MTVAELIKAPSAVDPDTEVMIVTSRSSVHDPDIYVHAGKVMIV